MNGAVIHSSYATGAYLQSTVTTSSPVDLVIRLYDGTIEFLEKAATAIGMNEVAIKLRYIEKSLAIVDELSRSLNMEAGGIIAMNLKELYDYISREMVLANAANDPEKLRHIIGIIKKLREGWVEIRNKS